MAHLIFLLSLAVLLSAARILGEFARRLGFPLIFAIVHDFVTNIFAPVFFAGLGLRADFVKSFDLRLCLLFFLIASAAKVVGCALGSRAGGLQWRPAAAVGFGLNARGAMEIMLALLALEAGLLREQVFVALVVMALATSLISGPAMKWLLRGANEDPQSLARQASLADT